MSATATATDYRALFDYAAQPKEAVNCPLCDRANPSVPATDRFGYAIGVSRCVCGMAYLNPRMTPEGYATFYETAYRPLTHAYCGTKAGHADQSTAGRGLAIGQAMQTRLSPGVSVLDVGGGVGTAARAAGHLLRASRVTVVDPNADELREAAARGCETIQGLVDTLQAPSAPADLVLCLLTADHWLDPLRALRWLRAACARYLWIDIVDVRVNLEPGGLAPWKIDHPLYWTIATFREALRRTGWAVTQIYWRTDKAGRPKRHRPNFLCEGA